MKAFLKIIGLIAIVAAVSAALVIVARWGRRSAPLLSDCLLVLATPFGLPLIATFVGWLLFG